MQLKTYSPVLCMMYFILGFCLGMIAESTIDFYVEQPKAIFMVLVFFMVFIFGVLVGYDRPNKENKG